MFQLGLDSFKVCIEQVIQQAALRRADLLAALGKLVAFEQGDFVSELLDDGFIVLDLSAHNLDLGLQLQRLCRQSTKLFRGHLVEVGRETHAADCARASLIRRQADRPNGRRLQHADHAA